MATMAVNHEAVIKELSTVRDWVRYAVSQFESADIFFGHGTDNSYDEAVWLIMRALNLPLDTLDNFLEASLIRTERKKLMQLIDKRVSDNTPTAYLLNEAWLFDYQFYVDERVIIPRSFIAELLADDLHPWVDHPELIESAADICTGSGCLGVLLADSFPAAQVDVVDISQDAIDVCNINIEKYDLQDRINAVKSDMFSALAGKQYDLIISNPPYVDAPSMATLPTEYQREPQLALGSGDAGLDHTHTLLKEAGNYLNEHGILIVEIGHNRDVLEAAYPQIAFEWLAVAAGNSYVFLLTKAQLDALASID